VLQACGREGKGKAGMILAHRTWGDPSGPVALLAHGGASSSAEWNELGLWLTDRGWHVIAVDLRGHGDSPVDEATIANPSLRANVDDLTETIAAVRPDAGGVGLLLGHSWGAIVGLACTVEQPEFAERLVLLEIGGRESSDRAQYAAEKRTRYLAAFRATQDAAVAKRNLAYALARHELFGTIDIVELAENCTVPTLVVLGHDKDTLLGSDGSVMDDLERYSGLIGDERKRFCAALQDAHIETVAGGHHFYREKLPELLVLLSSWLDESERTERPSDGRRRRNDAEDVPLSAVRGPGSRSRIPGEGVRVPKGGTARSARWASRPYACRDGAR
jgi:pimeloyl-ACP methyl ester carboxylesterase